MINVGGNNVNPIEIETIIDEIPGVKKSHVFGKPNPILGNMLHVKIQIDRRDITELSIKNIWQLQFRFSIDWKCLKPILPQPIIAKFILNMYQK